MGKTYWKDYMKKELEDNRAYEHAKEIKFDDEELFWVPIRRFNEEEQEFKQAGKIQCSLRVYPKADADKNDQGKGRDEPNNDPYCPPPEGRLELSLNPFKMFAQLVGPAVRRKIYCCCYCAALIALCVMMAPMIFSNIVSSVLNPFA